MKLEPAWFHNWRIRQVQAIMADVRIISQRSAPRPLFHHGGCEFMTRQQTVSYPRFLGTALLPWPAILAFALSLTATAASAGGVSFTETDSSLRLDNGLVAVEFDRKDGAWTSLTHRSIDGSLVGRERLGPGVDFRIDETWMVETLGSVLLRHAVERNAASGAATLALTYGVGKRPPFAFIPERWKDRTPDPAPAYSPPPPYEFELTVCSTLLPDSPRIDRRATLVRNLGKNFFRSSFRRLDGFLFVLPNVVVGRPQDCTVNVPGPLYTYTFVEAGTPYEKLAGTYIGKKRGRSSFHGNMANGMGKEKSCVPF